MDGSSLPVDSQHKLFGLVWGLAAIWCQVYIHKVIKSEAGKLSQWLWAMLTAP